MTERAQAVLASALRLTVEERAELATELIASLDGEPDADVEVAWAAEIERRVRRLQQEGSRGRPWREIFDRYRRQPSAVIRTAVIEPGADEDLSRG